jgi:putative endonuclease
LSFPAAGKASREGNPDFTPSGNSPGGHDKAKQSCDSFTMHERYAVYLLASKRNGTLYIGVTGNLALRVEQQVKGWNRAWKLKLIEAANPDWLDLDPAT